MTRFNRFQWAFVFAPVALVSAFSTWSHGDDLHAAMPMSKPATNPAARIFESNDQHVRFTYPGDWTIKKQVSNEQLPLGLSLLVGDVSKPAAIVIVTVDNSSDDSTESLIGLKAVTIAKFTSALANFKVTEDKPATVGKLTGSRVEATCDGKEQPVRILYYFVVRGDKAYTFELKTWKDQYDAALKPFERMIDSIEWIAPRPMTTERK